MRTKKTKVILKETRGGLMLSAGGTVHNQLAAIACFIHNTSENTNIPCEDLMCALSEMVKISETDETETPPVNNEI